MVLRHRFCVGVEAEVVVGSSPTEVPLAPKKYAAGPAYVLGTTFKEGFNIETSEDADDMAHVDTLAETFSSEHPGGAFFMFCDGGVRFIWDDTDPSVMNTHATRDGKPHTGVERVIHESPF